MTCCLHHHGAFRPPEGAPILPAAGGFPDRFLPSLSEAGW